MFRIRTLVRNARPAASTAYRTWAGHTCLGHKTPQLGRFWLSANHPRRHYAAPVAAEPFLNGSSSNYVEEMYNAWQEDPSSVHKVGFYNPQRGFL